MTRLQLSFRVLAPVTNSTSVSNVSFNLRLNNKIIVKTVKFINGYKANNDAYKSAKISLTAHSYSGQNYSFAINKVGKERECKERKNLSWHFHAFVGKIGLNDHNKLLHMYYGRQRNEYICAILQVNISRNIDSGGVQNRVAPLLHGWVLQLQH